MRSDDLWTGKLSKTIVMNKMIGMINLKNTGTGIPIHILSTNQHVLLSNIELRTMNEENNPGTGVVIIASELELGKQRIIEDNISIKNINPVTMTEMITNKSDNREK